uniref:XIAP-associated factor 1 n=1 Tax=Centroberyx gerrardi TaxID=166262 RepID=UPI003AAB9845
MDNKEATRICGQCHKEVAEANFALHEPHCRRFLCLCPDCDESVPREQLDQHREEQHTQVKCSKCNRKVERCHLMDHESDECVERLRCCGFCQLEVPWRELAEHSEACGSRTERCGDCGRYVTLKDQLEHGQTCPATAAGSSDPPLTVNSAPNKRQISVTCSGCKASFPAEDIEEHELECVPAEEAEEEKEDREEEEEKEDREEEEGGDFSREASPQLSSSLKAASMSNRLSREPWGDARDPDQISTCPHCHLALPLITLRWHEAKCQIHILLK